MRTVYLAAPLFQKPSVILTETQDEIKGAGFNVFPAAGDSNNIKDETSRQKIIFNKNLKGIENSDILVAVIDVRMLIQVLHGR